MLDSDSIHHTVQSDSSLCPRASSSENPPPGHNGSYVWESSKSHRDLDLKGAIISPAITLQEPELLLRHLLLKLRNIPDGHHAQYEPLLVDHKDDVTVQKILSALTPGLKKFLVQGHGHPYASRL